MKRFAHTVIVIIGNIQVPILTIKCLDPVELAVPGMISQYMTTIFPNHSNVFQTSYLFWCQSLITAIANITLSLLINPLGKPYSFHRILSRNIQIPVFFIVLLSKRIANLPGIRLFHTIPNSSNKRCCSSECCSFPRSLRLDIQAPSLYPSGAI